MIGLCRFQAHAVWQIESDATQAASYADGLGAVCNQASEPYRCDMLQAKAQSVPSDVFLRPAMPNPSDQLLRYQTQQLTMY